MKERKTKGYWTYDTCKEEAKKYKTITDFMKGCSRAYTVARTNGWIGEYEWFEAKHKQWTYETCLEEAKKYKSKAEFQKHCVSAYQKALKTGWIEEYDWLKRPEAQKKWTYETCKEESKKYSSRGEFDKGCRGAYSIAFKNGWIEEYDWLEWRKNPDGYWNYDTCKEEAKKYTSRGDFSKNSSVAYSVARKNGWLNEYDWFEVLWEKRWNYDTCKEEAKKFKYKIDFVRNSASAYGVARKNGWIEEYTWLETPPKELKWNHETCMNEAKKYKSKVEFQKNCYSAYDKALKNGWLDEYYWLKRPEVQRKWTYETCKEEAKKFKTRSSFYEGNRGAYKVAKKNGWIEEYDWFEQNQKPRGYWTYETCLDEAKKYKTISEFQKTSCRAYELSRKNGWLSEFSWFEQQKKSKGFWTYETCKEEAKKYKTRGEFCNNNGSAYMVAQKNKWLDEYEWFEQKQKPNGYWKYETCLEEAKKYTTRKEFGDNCSAAYTLALKNGWINEYTWFAPSKTAKRWTYEACMEEAKKYKSRHELEIGCSTVYHKSVRNGWINDYYWFEQKQKPSGYWTYGTCMEEAKKYKSRGELKKYSNGAYHIARKNGWLDEYTWFDDMDDAYKTKRGHCIYAYVWNEESVAYVGLTHRKQQRHRNHSTKENSPVFRFSRDNNLPIPNPIYIEEGLSHEEAQKKEAYYIEQYNCKGYNMLNSAPAGSLGVFGKGKWNYDACKEEAMKYSSRNEFKHGNSGAYNASRANGWIEDYFWFKALWRKWNYETCKEESKKFKTRGEFCDCSGSAYSAALRNGWLDDYFWLKQIQKPSGYWTYETCMEEAKKYKSRSEFVNSNGSAYNVAKKNGWMDSYDWFEPSKTEKRWDYESCREEAMKCKSRGEFRELNSRAYELARRNNWLDEYDWFEEKIRRNYWNYDTCMELAKECKSKSEFSKSNAQAYHLARINNWLKDYYWFERPAVHNKKWDYYACKEEAKKYNTKIAFQKGSAGAYDAARDNNWLADYDWFEQKQKPRGYWTYDRCKEESKKYKTRGEFQKCCVRGYNLSLKNGWLDEYDWLASSKTGKKWTYETCKEEAKKYRNKSSYAEGNSRAYSIARKNGWLDEFFE